MRAFKLLSSFLLSGLLYSAHGQVDFSYHRIKVLSSQITINGKTNVNRFECQINRTALNDSILVKNIWSNLDIEFEGLVLKYRITDFECGINAMDREFRELLKAEEEPLMLLRLDEINICPDNDSFEVLDVDATATIRLAGVEKKMNIENGTVINHSSAKMTLKGDKKLLMTDFGIDPPTKFLGIIKVTDDIEVAFEIAMEVSVL